MMLASLPRRRVFDALVLRTEAIDAATVADELSLHVTTARFHLDQLVRGGLAQRRAEVHGRRGRPRMLYSATGPVRADDAREQLIGVLAAALSREADGADESVRAGRGWADSFELDVTAGAFEGLADVLHRLGFGPEMLADRIELHDCPFRDAAREHPEVVCSVHRGLVEQLVTRAGADGQAELLPFIQPDLCRVALHRREHATFA